MANIIDRVVGWFSPAAGARRVVARNAMERFQKRSGAGSNGRLNQGWNAAYGNRDSQSLRTARTVQARARAMERDSPLVATILSRHADYMVGTGINIRAETGRPEMDKKVNELIEVFIRTCHADGTMGLYGILRSLAVMMVRDGEGLLRKRTRRREDGLRVPLQLQVLESEYLDWNKYLVSATEPVVAGVEFDQIGRRKGYWLFNQNPLSGYKMSIGDSVSKFVPASDVVHLFEPIGNQTRGLSWLEPVLDDIKDLEDYELAESVRKKAEACMVGVIIPGDDDAGDPNIGLIEKDSSGTTLRDTYGNPVERMEPGMFAVMHGGKDIRFNTPAISAGMESYIRDRKRTISSCVRMPYEVMTGDFSQANFASGKLGLTAYKRMLEIVQWELLIGTVLEKVMGWFLEAIKLAGEVPPNLEVVFKYEPPEFETIDRLEEAKADLMEMRIGKRSPQQVIQRTGYSPDTVLAEWAAWVAMIDSAGLIFDSDPRKVTQQGILQQTETGAGNASGNGSG